MRHILTEVWCCSRRMSQVVLKWVNMFQKVSKRITCKCDKRMLLKKRLPRSMISTVATCTRPPDTSVHSFVTTPTPTDHQTFTLRHIWPLPCRCYGDHFVIWFFWMLRSSSANTIYRLYHLLHVTRLAIETLPSPSDSIRFIHLHSALWSVQEVAGSFVMATPLGAPSILKAVGSCEL